MPEGRPLFATECLALLDRAGVSVEEAELDFMTSKEEHKTNAGSFRYGKLGIYQFRRTVVFGQNDDLVMRVWMREDWR